MRGASGAKRYKVYSMRRKGTRKTVMLESSPVLKFEEKADSRENEESGTLRV